MTETTDEITEFDAVEEDILEATVSDGTTYEFPASHLPQLKGMFDSLEIDGAEVPEFNGTSENFRERVSADGSE
ncbi:hypothetical protein [Natrinema versiforme]|uniref:Uncharacterized protein n=1 Tax=Natrinema versiforme TaxID=88724 RepID=A0A4P8WM88_9EURY|nr:hypothetical protein [Natrinema versiforme]QCS44679.1 hypothetical protein FEJ81_20470 [Natrinema versiforme]